MDQLPETNDRQRVVLELLLEACADAYYTTVQALRSNRRPADVTEARKLFCALGRVVVNRPMNKRTTSPKKTQLTVLATHLCKHISSIVYLIEEGNRVLEGSVGDEVADRFRAEASNILDDLGQSGLVRHADELAKHWQLPEPHPLRASVIRERAREAAASLEPNRLAARRSR